MADLLDLTTNVQNYRIYRGVDFPFTLGFKDSVGVPIPIIADGWQVKATFREYKTGTLIQQMTIGAGLVSTGTYPQLSGKLAGTGTAGLPVGDDCPAIAYQVNTVDPAGIKSAYLFGVFYLKKEVPQV